jgi:RNA recognition motif-containing protein
MNQITVNVYVPKDRVTNLHQGYGFVEFRSEEDADYAIKILNMIKLDGKPIRVNKASQDKKSLDVGANLFVGNLDPVCMSVALLLELNAGMVLYYLLLISICTLR